jgi:hypothetical protein
MPHNNKHNDCEQNARGYFVIFILTWILIALLLD